MYHALHFGRLNKKMQENYIVGIYARLSRDDERAGESVSIENQKEMLARYVREQGWAAATLPPQAIISSKLMVSARMKPRSMSE